MSWIKLHDSFLDWEWYKDSVTKNVFIHCLLKANWKDSKFEGYEVPRGSFVTSLKKLSEELSNKKQKIGIQSIRTALNHLSLTQELTIKKTSKFTIITVNNYDLYQSTNTVSNNQLTRNQHATNNQLTTIEDIYIFLTSYLERIYARTITELEFEKIKKWLEIFDYTVIQHAIDISVLNNAKNFNYVEAVLKNWKSAKHKTLDDVLAEERRIEQAKQQLAKKNEEQVHTELFDYNWLDE